MKDGPGRRSATRRRKTAMKTSNSRNRAKAAILALAIACGAWAGTAWAVLTDPAQIMNEAYINLVQGDQSLDAGQLDEALGLYVQARDYYRRLADEFPGFEPRIILYRRTYCDNQIAEVERRKNGGEVGAEVAAAAQNEPFAPAAKAPAAQPTYPQPEALAPMMPSAEPAAAVADRSVEIDYLKSRVNSLEEELAETDGLQDEIDRLVADNDRLAQQLEATKRQLAEKAGGESEVERLRAELAAKNEEILGLRRELDAKRQLDQALNDMEAKYNEQRAMNERLNEEIANLDAELDAAEERAEKAEARPALAAAPAEPKPGRDEARAQRSKDEAKKSDARKEEKGVSPTGKTGKTAGGDLPGQGKAAEASAKAEAKASEPAAAAAAAKAPAKPLPIPEGTSAAEFVRQLLQKGENEVALATVREARKDAKADMNLALIEGIALIRLQSYSEAATMLIDIAKRNPRNAEVNATLGAAMMGAGFHEEARETLLLALKYDKNLPECHYNLAQLYAYVEPTNLRLARRHYQNARDFGIPADAQLEAALK